MQASIARVRRWIGQNIRRRLIFWSTVFWVVAISLFSVAFLGIGQNQMITDNRQRNIQLASVVSRDINAQLNSIFTDNRNFGRRLENLAPNADSQAAAALALRLSAPQRYQAVYYFDRTGGLLFAVTEPLENLLLVQNASEIVNREATDPGRAVFTTYLKTLSAGTFTSDVYFTELDRSPVFYTGLMVKFADGDNRVVVLEISLQDIWQRINLITIGTSGFTYVVSNQGIIIAHPLPSYLGRPVDANLMPLVAGFEGFAEYNDPASGQKVLAAYSPVGGQTGWGIVLEQNVSEANALIFRTGLYIAVIWVALAVIGTLVFLLMIGTFSRPIVALTRTTQNIARTGNLKKTGMAGTDEVGQLSAAFDQMIERLQTTEDRLANAAAEERNRLARDLHDAVSQTLFSASIIAEVLPKLWEKNPEEGLRRLEEIRQLTRGALAEMRTLLFELRPAALADAEIGHLLRQLVESLAGRLRIPVEVEIDNDCQLPVDVKIVFYRIAQEALNNVVKHSGATQARVTLNCRPGGVSLSITDNGRGFDTAQLHTSSLGLNIMRDRAAGIGAVVVTESKVGAGTTITVVWSGQDKGDENERDQTDPGIAG